MADIEIKLVVNNKDEIMQILHQRLLVSLEACGLQAERYAKLKCTVDTGRLRNSITHSVSGNASRVHTYTIDKLSKYDSANLDKKGNQKRASKAVKAAETRHDLIPAVPETPEQMILSTNVQYGPYIELGYITPSGKHIPARPFMKPALQNHKNVYKAIFKRYLSKD